MKSPRRRYFWPRMTPVLSRASNYSLMVVERKSKLFASKQMAIAERRNIEFGVEGGVTLRGWLFVPGAKGPAPAITMAHGYAGVKEHGLERFARAFAEAGFVVLVHDHRHFGASDGAERGDVDPWQQIADWRRAISFLESRPEVDTAQIGIWGTSYAGGHAIVLGATDRRLRAVVAQVPTISGFEQGLRRVAPDGIAALERAFAEDDRGQLRGEPLRRQLALAAYERALELKKLQLISGGHFAPYLDQFPLAVAAATEWFSEHLLNPGARRVTQVAIHSASAQANSDIADV